MEPAASKEKRRNDSAAKSVRGTPFNSSSHLGIARPMWIRPPTQSEAASRCSTSIVVASTAPSLAAEWLTSD